MPYGAGLAVARREWSVRHPPSSHLSHHGTSTQEPAGPGRGGRSGPQWQWMAPCRWAACSTPTTAPKPTRARKSHASATSVLAHSPWAGEGQPSRVPVAPAPPCLPLLSSLQLAAPPPVSLPPNRCYQASWVEQARWVCGSHLLYTSCVLHGGMAVDGCLPGWQHTGGAAAAAANAALGSRPLSALHTIPFVGQFRTSLNTMPARLCLPLPQCEPQPVLAARRGRWSRGGYPVWELLLWEGPQGQPRSS